MSHSILVVTGLITKWVDACCFYILHLFTAWYITHDFTLMTGGDTTPQTYLHMMKSQWRPLFKLIWNLPIIVFCYETIFFFIKWRICIDRLKDQKVRTEVWHENCRLESIPCKFMCMSGVCYNKKGYIHAHNSLFWPSLAYYLLILDSIFFILNTNHIIGKMTRWIWFLC